MKYENGRYLLTAEDGTTTLANGQLRLQDDGTPSLRLVGVVQDSQVMANVAVVGDAFHIFTKVRYN